MPRIPNMRNTQMMMIITFRIPHIDWPNEEMMILISKFLDTMRRGLSMRNNFKMLRST